MRFFIWSSSGPVAVGVDRWAAWCASEPPARRVAIDWFHDGARSAILLGTTFAGVDLRDEEPPPVWQTYVATFGLDAPPRAALEQRLSLPRAYAAREQAEAGHAHAAWLLRVHLLARRALPAPEGG